MFIWRITVTLVLLAVLAGLITTSVESKRGRGSGKDLEKKLKCGAHKPLQGPRIRNRAGKGEFPFLVDISVIEEIPSDGSKSRASYNCSGVIISKRRVLTSLKCIGHGKFNKTKYEIRVGNLKYSKGKLLEMKKISSEKYDLYPKDDADDHAVPHGLALIKVSRKIKYSLDHKNHTDINRICFSQNNTFSIDDATMKNVEMFAPNWVPGHKRAKAIALNTTKCEPEVSGRGAICTRLAGSKNYGGLQEGSPLVRYKGKKRWEIIGIHSRRFEPWSDCNDDRCAEEPPNFIPVHEKSMKKWLIDEIFKSKTRSNLT